MKMRTENRTPAHNRRLAKVAVQCSVDTFVVNQSLALRINICGENRHLRQAPKRYRALLPDGQTADASAKYFVPDLHFV